MTIVNWLILNEEDKIWWDQLGNIIFLSIWNLNSFLKKKMEFKLWEFFLGLEFEWAQGAVF